MTVEARVDDPVTERRLEATADLDLRSTVELVELINDEDATVAAAVRGAAGELAAVDAEECPATFGVDPGVVVSLVAGDERLEDDARAGVDAVAAAGVGDADAVVTLSGGGRTPYVLGAVEAARETGALTVAIVCAAGAPVAAAAERSIEVVVGPEVIAGSTRMKAGTAQKLVLNTISTTAMVRLGKTFGNLMVAVVDGNAKLRGRARRSVELATGAAGADVEAALDAAGGDARVAIVSLLAAVDAGEARARLERNGGRVRPSLDQA